MNENKNRYIRQEQLLGKKGQETIEKKEVTIVGIGALGTVCSDLLLRAGVKKINLIDRDIVEITNLQRQSLFCQKDIGKSKVEAAKEKLLLINENTKINIQARQIDTSSILEIIPKSSSLILDCSDNMKTRFLINDYAKKNKIPLIYAGAIEDKGSLQLILKDSACFNCSHQRNSLGETCSSAGVFAMTTYSIAAFQSYLAIQVLAEKNLDFYCNKLFRFNLNELNSNYFIVKKRKDCPSCKGEFPALKNNQNKETIRFCSSGLIQINRKNKINLKLLYKTARLEFPKAICDNTTVRFDNMTFFSDGRALIVAKTTREAIAKYEKYVKS